MKIEPAAAISGHIAVPGDKSLSHRAVLLAAVGEGETRITGFGRSEDTEATIKAVRDLGVRVYEADPETLRVFGAGLRGLKAPKQPLDCGNAGTLMRLLPGAARRPGGPLRAHRRRVASLPADGADRRAAAADGGRPSRRRTAGRRSRSRAAR